jgi:hypothetical protein
MYYGPRIHAIDVTREQTEVIKGHYSRSHHAISAVTPRCIKFKSGHFLSSLLKIKLSVLFPGDHVSADVRVSPYSKECQKVTDMLQLTPLNMHTCTYVHVEPRSTIYIFLIQNGI